MKEDDKYKILFISHDASRTGAPFALIYIIEQLKKEIGVKTDILVKVDGPLSEKFEKLGNVFVYSRANTHHSQFSRIMSRIFRIKQRKEKRIINRIISNDYDLIYANSAASSDILLKLLKYVDKKTVLHVHELKIMIKRFCGERSFIEAANRVDKIFAVSSLVERMLLEEYSLDTNKIIKVYEPISQENKLETKKFKAGEPFIIAGSGTLDWRKGTDLFIAVIKQLNLTYPDNNILFLWIGGNLDSQEFDVLQNDLVMAGLEDKLSFTGSVPNPRDYFKNSNVFLLTSREDPFPLVALENAYEGNPIICFRKATGISDFIDSTCGLTVDFLDIQAIVTEIHKLSSDENYYTNKSKKVRELSTLFTPESVCKPIVHSLKELLKNQS